MGTIKKAIENLLGWNKTNVFNSKFVTANQVLFSSFGKDITASDIVKTAIHRIAEEVSKCNIKSVIEKNSPKTVEILDDDINAVFSQRLNPLCGLKDFLYKITYLTMVNQNCFIYWKYDEVPIKGTEYVRRVTRGFYPIENAKAHIYLTSENEMRIELTSLSGDVVFDLPYSDVIHIRHRYGANQYLGGGINGSPDNRGLLENLQTIQVIKEAIPKSLEASLSLKGILTMKTVADVDKKVIARDEFEEHLFNSKYGIMATDYESDFTPVNISATDIPTNVLSFLRDEILSPLGVSLPIYLGKYTDDEYTAFYQTAIEGLLLEIQQAFKIVLFTDRQIQYGHTIKCYDRLIQSLSFSRRQEICEMTRDDALLSRTERRELLGYEPDGEPTRMSLNYIDTSIANKYQLEDIKNKAQEDNNATG